MLEKTVHAIEKYTKIEQQSTIVVIIGDAHTAGSNLNFLTINGNNAPIDLAKITTKIL